VQDGSLTAADFAAGQLPAGPQGVAGLQGTQGVQGLTGATGATGSAGQAGQAGPKGDKGDRGDSGTVGAVGVTSKGIWIAAGTADTVTRLVEPGHRALSAGTAWSARGTDLIHLATVSIEPLIDQDGHVIGYRATGANTTASPRQFWLHVLYYAG